ncbi:hypothetical protein HCG49_08020 [Arenibacter sp. 6A1]|uniref:histidine kinase dimerization/phosphoacceptor domain -containing protein n=1 Tax=Arenibacter sp. 6A1 TaxID=2720391 RepID=UPI0014483B01|nr:histidine kinase dimerization/phosphoacceptor domain -containing protein [Arenibacter sp. 6A1]NKI26507.1 hypothetical protein [Arenibacter sp. 6A1]
MISKKSYKYLIILLIGGLISSLLFYYANQRRIAENEVFVENTITRAKLKFNQELLKVNTVLESMAFFFENNKQVTLDKYIEFTNPFVSGLPGIRALEWAPRLSPGNLMHLDEGQVRVLDSSFNITKINFNSAHGNFAPTRDYYPIIYTNPRDYLQKVIGLDIASVPMVGGALRLADSTQKIVSSKPLNLITSKNREHFGFVMIKAVFGTDKKQVDGYVLGVYDMTAYIETILGPEMKVLDIFITDVTEEILPLYYSSPILIKNNNLKASNETSIDIGNRKWEIQFFAKEGLLVYPHTRESYFLLLFGMVISSLIGVIAFKNDRYQNTLENEVRTRTLDLEKSNKEKENLLQEIHHRVKNNLQMTSSLINIQKRKLTNKAAIAALEESQSRISAIALTHQKIYQDENSKSVNLREYLTDLMAYQKKLLPSVNYAIHCSQITLNLDVALPIGLIISELVTNALKHAFKEHQFNNNLSITVIQDREGEQLIHITVADNGKGLPPDFDPNYTSGIGFKIINSFCKQITGKLSYNSSSQGTCFTLSCKNLENLI